MKAACVALAAGCALALMDGAQAQHRATEESRFPVRSFTIATATKNTAYFLVGQEMARQIRRQCADCEVKVRETAGGIENLQLLQRGEVDIALVNAAAAWEASIGIKAFKDKPVPMRALAALSPNSMHFVVRRAAGIRRLEDLRGKRIATGAPGSGTEVITIQLLKACGLDPDRDVMRNRLGVDEAIAAMRSGQIDAFLFGAAVPVKAIDDLMREGQTTLVSTADAIASLDRIYARLYKKGLIPAGTYPHQDTDVKPMDVWDLVVVSETLPGAVAFELTRSLFERKSAYVEAHQNMRFLSLDVQSDQTTISFHLGAQRYYARRGLQPFARAFSFESVSAPRGGAAPSQ